MEQQEGSAVPTEPGGPGQQPVPDSNQAALRYFEVGQLVELTDLQGAPHLNGKQGKVVEARAEGGRVGVLLADKRAPISLKPSNLKLF
eukprot:821097-Rhodomonas_salina.2